MTLPYPNRIEDNHIAKAFRDLIDAINATALKSQETASALASLRVPTMTEIQTAIALGGSNPLNLTGLLGISGNAQVAGKIGTFAARPGAASVPAGSLYFATDQGTIYITTGSAWTTVTRRILIGGFYGIFSHANTADRTYSLPNVTANLVYATGALTNNNFAFGGGGALVKDAGFSVVPIANGGTAGSTAAAARSALSAAQIQAPGGPHTITLAKITGGGVNGSLTFTAEGVISGFVDPT